MAQKRNRGANQREIAYALEHNPSTFYLPDLGGSSELKQNGSGDKYYAAQAQHRAKFRQRDRTLVRKMEIAENCNAVCSGIKKFWSPEQTSDRLEPEFREKTMVSARTIYN